MKLVIPSNQDVMNNELGMHTLKCRGNNGVHEKGLHKERQDTFNVGQTSPVLCG